MAYEVVMPYHLHMPSYFLETFTEYPKARAKKDGEDKYPSPSFLFDFDFFLHVYLFPLQVVEYIFQEC